MASMTALVLVMIDISSFPLTPDKARAEALLGMVHRQSGTVLAGCRAPATSSDSFLVAALVPYPDSVSLFRVRRRGTVESWSSCFAISRRYSTE